MGPLPMTFFVTVIVFVVVTVWRGSRDVLNLVVAKGVIVTTPFAIINTEHKENTLSSDCRRRSSLNESLGRSRRVSLGGRERNSSRGKDCVRVESSSRSNRIRPRITRIVRPFHEVVLAVSY